MSRAYYNEREPYAAQWLRNLIAADLIAPGDVDERDILDVRPSDLKGYTQCHFFAGIGVWSYALRRAGWPDDRRVWTGSCPCQPFSQAGEGLAFDDERHLWPHWFHLIAQFRPPVIFGEQVASKDALPWLDLVHADLEAAGYAVGDADLCAAGVGAPHIRQRLFFVADRAEPGRGGQPRGLGEPSDGGSSEPGRPRHARGVAAWEPCDCCDEFVCNIHGMHAFECPCPPIEEWDRDPYAVGSVADGSGEGLPVRERPLIPGEVGHDEGRAVEQRGGAPDGSLDDADDPAAADDVRAGRGVPGGTGDRGGPGPTNGYWADADWLTCRDGKWRPVEPGTFPLAHGPANRVGRLRAAGNAIVAQVAEEFIGAYLDLTT